MTLKNLPSSASRAPPGKVACLLCGGFISVSGGDRARFIDHMSNEHDAKGDCHDILLAVCALDSKEKGFLVKSTCTRLDTIGRGKPANYSDSFMNKLSGASLPPPPAPQQKQTRNNVSRAPPPPQQQRRVAPRAPTTIPSRAASTVSRPRQVQQRAPVQAAKAPVSGLLRGNSQISVSKVDMRRKCNMCQLDLPNPKALIEHMNRNHFNLPGGINIITDGSSSSSSSLTKFKQNLARQIAKPSPPPARSTKVIAQKVTVTPPPKLKTIEMVTCQTCGKAVEKSRYSFHKLSHAQERKEMKTNVLKNSSIVLTKADESTVEAVEADPLSTSDIAMELDENVEITNSDYECNICEKRLASDKGLKLHRNSEHGENNPIDNETQEEIKNQIGDLETSELLDNLVNFLQED